MAYASQSGRSRTSSRNPRAFAVCQRCGIWYNRVNLQFQFQWRGAQLQNTYILVCRPCLDIPTEQNRAIILPADPVPIFYPSIEDFEADETDYRSLSAPTITDPVIGIPIPGTTLRVTQDCQNRVTTPFGKPTGEDQNAVMPFNGGTQQHFGTPLSLLSVTSNGSATVQVTCYAPHGIPVGGQVSVEGLAAKAANGFYSVAVLTAMAFTYQTYGSIPAQSLLTPSARIITALVGLPRGFDAIPKIDGPPLTIANPVLGDFIGLESGFGAILLEDDSGFIELED